MRLFSINSSFKPRIKQMKITPVMVEDAAEKGGLYQLLLPSLP